jgi:hypothetical protein
MIKKPLKVMKIGVLWFYGFALLAHFIVPEGYSIINNNVSQLGAQGFEYAFIMRIAFIGSALFWIFGIYLNYKTPTLHRSVSIGFFFIAISIIVAGIFRVPLPGFTEEPNILYQNIHLAAGHASQLAGLFILLEHIYKSDKIMRKRHIIVFILLFVFSLFFQFAPFIGISQRLLALTHSIWTFKYLNVYR